MSDDIMFNDYRVARDYARECGYAVYNMSNARADGTASHIRSLWRGTLYAADGPPFYIGVTTDGVGIDLTR